MIRLELTLREAAALHMALGDCVLQEDRAGVAELREVFRRLAASEPELAEAMEPSEIDALMARVAAQRAALEEELEAEQHPGERFGFGVCATGRCVEPCGPNGGCMRGSRRRSRGR